MAEASKEDITSFPNSFQSKEAVSYSLTRGQKLWMSVVSVFVGAGAILTPFASANSINNSEIVKGRPDRAKLIPGRSDVNPYETGNTLDGDQIFDHDGAKRKAQLSEVSSFGDESPELVLPNPPEQDQISEGEGFEAIPFNVDEISPNYRFWLENEVEDGESDISFNISLSWDPDSGLIKLADQDDFSNWDAQALLVSGGDNDFNIQLTNVLNLIKSVPRAGTIELVSVFQGLPNNPHVNFFLKTVGEGGTQIGGIPILTGSIIALNEVGEMVSLSPSAEGNSVMVKVFDQSLFNYLNQYLENLPQPRGDRASFLLVELDGDNIPVVARTSNGNLYWRRSRIVDEVIAAPQPMPSATPDVRVADSGGEGGGVDADWDEGGSSYREANPDLRRGLTEGMFTQMTPEQIQTKQAYDVLVNASNFNTRYEEHLANGTIFYDLDFGLYYDSSRDLFFIPNAGLGRGPETIERSNIELGWARYSFTSQTPDFVPGESGLKLEFFVSAGHDAVRNFNTTYNDPWVNAPIAEGFLHLHPNLAGNSIQILDIGNYSSSAGGPVVSYKIPTTHGGRYFTNIDRMTSVISRAQTDGFDNGVRPFYQVLGGLEVLLFLDENGRAPESHELQGDFNRIVLNEAIIEMINRSEIPYDANRRLQTLPITVEYLESD